MRDIFLTACCIASPLLVVSRSVFLIVPQPPIYIPRWFCVTTFVDQGRVIDLMKCGIYRLLSILLRLPFWSSPVCSFSSYHTLLYIYIYIPGWFCVTTFVDQVIVNDLRTCGVQWLIFIAVCRSFRWSHAHTSSSSDAFDVGVDTGIYCTNTSIIGFSVTRRKSATFRVHILCLIWGFCSLSSSANDHPFVAFPIL